MAKLLGGGAAAAHVGCCYVCFGCVLGFVACSRELYFTHFVEQSMHTVANFAIGRPQVSGANRRPLRVSRIHMR
jgi:hypothetical protein